MRSDRAGFTLMEVLIAMVILGIALLGVQAAMTDRLLGDMGRQNRRATAMQLATSRLQAIQVDPDYLGLSTSYVSSGDTIAGFPGYKRVTLVSVAQGFTTVTVRVIGPGQRDTVSRTAVVGAP